MADRHDRRLDLTIQEDLSSLIFFISLVSWSFPQEKQKNLGNNTPSPHVFHTSVKWEWKK